MIKIQELFQNPIQPAGNYAAIGNAGIQKNQSQTNEVFSDKWNRMVENAGGGGTDDWGSFQLDWYLKMYGFENEDSLRSWLSDKYVILDAGCGMGYKAAWFARLAPQALVIAMDYSDSCQTAARKYKHLTNLYFIRGDIARTGIHEGRVDYVSCDQVIMHTEHPEDTFRHLSSLLKPEGEFACSVYARKALPRELLDDYFREATHHIAPEDLWQMSRQLTELGKRLSELNVNIDVPDIPLLGIRAGVYDIQRFIYWNLMKCFYKPDWSEAVNDAVNFDWYSPSNARRYTEEEFKAMIQSAGLTSIHFHTEEACHSGRFAKKAS